MCDLEDKILKKNIPGKYTWWDKDSDEENSLHGSDDSNYDPDAPKLTDMQKVQKWEEQEIPKPLQMAALNNLRKGQGGACNTGVKGVLADYKEAKAQKIADYEIQEEIKEILIEQVANGVSMRPGETSISAASMNLLKQQQRDVEDRGNKDDDDGEDLEFIANYRQNRLAQMKYSTTFPSFGSISEVDPFEFADEIDKTDPRAYLVVHMYEPGIPECKKVNRFLEGLARDMPWVRFLRLHAMKANMNIDHIALPIVMVYKAGELEQNFCRVQDDLPKDFTAADVRWLLENCGLVDPASVEYDAGSNAYDQDNFADVIRNSKGVSKNGFVSGEAWTKTNMWGGLEGGLEQVDADSDDLDEFCADFEGTM